MSPTGGISRRLSADPGKSLSIGARALGFFAVSFVFWALSSAAGAPASYADPTPSPSPSHAEIANAFSFYVSTAGQSYLYGNTLSILQQALGRPFESGSMDKFDYPIPQAINLTDLPPWLAPYSKQVNDIVSVLADQGIALKNPRPDVTLTDLGYAAIYKTFGLRVDPELTAQQDGGGIVMDLDIDASQVKGTASTLRLEDLANKGFFGVFGANDLMVDLLPSSPDLQLTIPFLLKVQDGDFEMQALDISSNLDQLKIEATADHPLVLPSIQLEVNGNVVLTQTALEDELMKRESQLLDLFQASLKSYVDSNGTVFLNKLAEKYNGPMVETYAAEPFGVNSPSPADAVAVGFEPQTIALTPSNLTLTASGFAEDPKISNSEQAALVPSAAAGGTLPEIDGVDPSTYDVMLSVNQGWINQMLMVSYKRGVWNEIKTPSDTLSMTAAPVFTLDAQDLPESQFDSKYSSKRQMKMHLSLQQSVSWIKAIFAGKKVQFGVDLWVRFEPHGLGDFGIVADHVDFNSITLNKKLVNIGAFDGTVLGEVKSGLKDYDKEIHEKETFLDDNLDLPTSVLGVQLGASDIQVEGNGNLLILYKQGL